MLAIFLFFIFMQLDEDPCEILMKQNCFLVMHLVIMHDITKCMTTSFLFRVTKFRCEWKWIFNLKMFSCTIKILNSLIQFFFQDYWVLQKNSRSIASRPINQQPLKCTSPSVKLVPAFFARNSKLWNINISFWFSLSLTNWTFLSVGGQSLPISWIDRYCNNLI